MSVSTGWGSSYTRAAAASDPENSPSRPSLGGPLVVARWFINGSRRLAVNTLDGAQVGWIDLTTNERSLAMPELEAAFEAAIIAAQPEVPQR